MKKPIPFLLWILQFIAVLITILCTYSLFLYVHILFESFTLTVLVGVLTYSIVIMLSVYLIVGIWKKLNSTRLFSLAYLYALLLVYTIINVLHFSSIPIEIQSQYRLLNIIMVSILGLAILVFTIRFQSSKKVRAYFGITSVSSGLERGSGR